MTRDEREKLKALAEKATPGPWRDEGDAIGYEPGREPWHVIVVGTETRGRAYMEYEALVMKDEDRAFIAATRTAVPALLRDLETADGLLRRAVEKNGPRAHADLCGVVSDLPCDCWLGAARAFLGEKP